MTAKWKINLALFVLVFSALACSLGQSAPPTAAPQTTIPPTSASVIPPTDIPLFAQVTLSPVSFSDSGEAPNYTITTETPTLEGVDDGRAVEFNVVMQLAVKAMVDGFKTSMQDMPATPIMAGSSFDVKYELLSPPGDIFSIKFSAMGYSDGAAHPYHFSRMVTFNLATGQDVTLDQLFLAGSDYLQIFSDVSKAELSTRDIGFNDEVFASGADPLPVNYQNWNITADGLLITFDEYQVAPYAAGPQTVTLPYSALKDVIDPQGPLGKFIQ